MIKASRLSATSRAGALVPAFVVAGTLGLASHGTLADGYWADYSWRSDGSLIVTAYCPRTSITNLIEHAPAKRHLVVRVVGVCHENVDIRRDGVTLKGDSPASSQIVGVPEVDVIDESPVSVWGAQQVRLENLTIRDGDSSGVAVVNSQVRIINSVLENNGVAGVAVVAGAGIVEGSTIRNNSQGLRAWSGGVLAVTNSQVIDNENEGVIALEGGSVRVGVGLDGIVGPVTVSGNGLAGVLATNSSSATVRSSTIDNNGGDGIILLRSSSADVRDNTIRSNAANGLAILQNSSAYVFSNQIYQNGTYEVVIADSGNGRLEANAITDDSVSNSVATALGVFRGSAVRLVGGNSLVQQNVSASAQAVSLFHNADFRQDTGSNDVVTGPIAIALGNFATADFRKDFIINGDVQVSSFGTFRVRGTGTINGDIEANSGLSTASESSGSNVTLNGTCTGQCFGF